MLILSIVIALATFVLVDFSHSSKVSPDLVKFMLGFTALAVLGHIAVRRLAPTSDPLLYPIAILLAGFGYGYIRRLAPDLASAQLGWIAIGMVAFIATLAIVRDHRQLEQFRYSFLLLGIALLLLPLTPIGSTLGRGVKLWVRLGPLAFQPAELAKVVLALFLAGYLAVWKESLSVYAARLSLDGTPLDGRGILVGKAILFARGPLIFPADGPWLDALRSPAPVEELSAFAAQP